MLQLRGHGSILDRCCGQNLDISRPFSEFANLCDFIIEHNFVINWPCVIIRRHYLYLIYNNVMCILEYNFVIFVIFGELVKAS